MCSGGLACPCVSDLQSIVCIFRKKDKEALASGPLELRRTVRRTQRCEDNHTNDIVSNLQSASLSCDL